jgi:hypothetical protein
MAEDVILPQWKKLLPTEKLGNTKESLVGQVRREVSQRKKKKRKGQELKSDAEQEREDATEGPPKDPEAQSGKIVDITI